MIPINEKCWKAGKDCLQAEESIISEAVIGKPKKRMKRSQIEIVKGKRKEKEKKSSLTV